jgi:acyl-CoA reductase-like NAD-dependent aldehyde dehydrogenase
MLIMLAFMHHGQICYGTERIILMESIADNFISLLKKEAENFNVGYPVIAKMSKGSYDKLLDAERNGAKFLSGGPKVWAEAFSCSNHLGWSDQRYDYLGRGELRPLCRGLRREE